MARTVHLEVFGTVPAWYANSDVIRLALLDVLTRKWNRVNSVTLGTWTTLSSGVSFKVSLTTDRDVSYIKNALELNFMETGYFNGIDNVNVLSISGDSQEPTNLDVRVTGSYTIRSGDTLTSIARRYNTTVNAILVLNPEVTNPDFIRVGQVLRMTGNPLIPSTSNPSAGSRTVQGLTQEQVLDLIRKGKNPATPAPKSKGVEATLREFYEKNFKTGVTVVGVSAVILGAILLFPPKK